MSATTLPADLPGLREEAERLAREFHAAYWRDIDVVPPKFAGKYRRQATDAHVALLRDLTRPASRDWAVRYLAERVGLVVGATAPRWTRDEDGAWTLSTGRASLVFCPEFCGSGMLPPTWDGVRYVSMPAGMVAITDPAAALAAAVLAVSRA